MMDLILVFPAPLFPISKTLVIHAHTCTQTRSSLIREQKIKTEKKTNSQVATVASK